MAELAIEFKNITKSYGSQTIVQSLDLAVSSGEFLVLLGPSGCGKSTILKMLAGIEAPDSGEIHVEGRMVNYALPRDRDVAMVFQNYALYPHMTVAENIGYPLKATGRRLSRDETDRRIREAAALVQIEDQLAKYPEAMSGGQRQRVALARALIREPAAFLMDEPLSNLDAKLRDAMRHQLIDLHRRIGKATIYVTHDQLEAMTMANRIVIMNQGIIQQIGTPEEIYRRPANLFVAEFIGYPAINLLGGQITASGQVRIGGLSLGCATGSGAEQAVTVGIRSADIRLGAGPNRFEALLCDSEFTGADTILTLRLDGGEDLRVRTALRGFDLGEKLELSIAPEDIHLFTATGTRI